MTKNELIKNLQAEYNHLQAALAQLTDEQMTVPIQKDGYSVKDILVHLTVWDERGKGWLRQAAAGQRPDVPLPGLTWSDMDRLNEVTFRENQDRSFDEVITQYRATFARLLDQLHALTDEDWKREYRLHKHERTRSVERMAGWRLRHLQSHSKPIHRWLTKVQKEAGSSRTLRSAQRE
jgi:hypothetical protein